MVNNKNIFKKSILFIVSIIMGICVQAQNVDLNNIALMDAQRIRSLLDSNQTSNSYTMRNSTFGQNFESVNWKKVRLNNFSLYTANQENLNLPLGFNDGAMIPSVGKQQYYNVQVGIQWGRFTLQLAPERVTAENLLVQGLGDDFDGSANGAYGNFWRRYYEIQENIIELPNKHHNTSSDEFYIGQSSLKFNLKNISFGVSNENLWWGPGSHYSLILTNNAPGFLHFTVNTNKPIKTFLGTVEGQIIGGSLKNINIPPSENSNPHAAQWYIPKDTAERYITGMILTLSPKWTKNLFVGVSNMAYMYKRDMNGLEDVTPFGNFSKYTRLKLRPALGTIFLRYAMPKDHAEFYLEYGRNDRGATPLNILQDSVPSGYVAGVRKLFPIGATGKYGAISLNIEVIQMKMPQANLIWNESLLAKQSSWYTNNQVTQGYTNQGQLLGSYIGPGGSGQTVHLAWLKGLNKLGIGVERFSHNKDFYYYNYFNGLTYPGPNFKYWSDFVYTMYMRVKIGNFIASGELKKSESYNYLWTKIGSGGIYGPSDTDRSNTQFNLSLRYLFVRKF